MREHGGFVGPQLRRRADVAVAIDDHRCSLWIEFVRRLCIIAVTRGQGATLNMPVIDHPKMERERFYRQLDALSLAPLWESLHRLVPWTPTPAATPAFW